MPHVFTRVLPQSPLALFLPPSMERGSKTIPPDCDSASTNRASAPPRARRCPGQALEASPPEAASVPRTAPSITGDKHGFEAQGVWPREWVLHIKTHLLTSAILTFVAYTHPSQSYSHRHTHSYTHTCLTCPFAQSHATTCTNVSTQLFIVPHLQQSTHP